MNCPECNLILKTFSRTCSCGWGKKKINLEKKQEIKYCGYNENNIKCTELGTPNYCKKHYQKLYENRDFLKKQFTELCNLLNQRQITQQQYWDKANFLCSQLATAEVKIFNPLYEVKNGK